MPSPHAAAPRGPAHLSPGAARGPGPGFPPPGGGGPRGPQPPRTQKTGFGAIALYSVLGLVAMAAGALAFAVMALPANFVRDKVVLAVKEKTGRDLVIQGPASFSLYPALGISLADVSLSGGPGFEAGAPLVTMKAMDVQVALWPLLKRDVQVRALVLREPVFNLETDADGRHSWDFAEADSGRVRLAQAGAPEPDAPVSDAAPPAASPARKRAPLGLSNVRLDDVRIDNGTLNWRDQRSASTSQLSAINVKLALASMAEPLTAAGHLDWNGETVRFDGVLTAPNDVIEDRPAKLKLVLGAAPLDATFEGSARLKGDLSAEGILSASSPSARALLGWFGTELAPSAGFGALKAKGLWRSSPDQHSFSTAEITLDQTTARGDLTLDTRGARPNVTANLKLTELDLNLYSSDGPPPPPAAPPAKAKAAKPKNATSIDDLLKGTDGAPPAHPAARVKGYTKRAGWSDEPLQLASLGILDAKMRLAIGKLTVSTLRLDQSDVTVVLKNRVMTTTLNDVRLYQGTAKGTVSVDGRRETAATVAANIALDGIEGLPLLKDLAEFDRLTGKGGVVLAVTGQGASERQIVSTLNGKVDVAFQDGAIIGINVAALARGLNEGKFSGLGTAPTDKTEFSEMTASWTLAQGVAQNSDLKLSSPLLRVMGSGRVGLPARDVDYMLRPKLVASLSGQGSGGDALSGLEIPVRVHGSWEDPKFTPDLSDVLKDPNKAMDTLKEIGGKLKGKKADEIVNDLLGGTKEERATKKEQGKKLLEQFLNGR